LVNKQTTRSGFFNNLLLLRTPHDCDAPDFAIVLNYRAITIYGAAGA
jgi:hypothetical protein